MSFERYKLLSEREKIGLLEANGQYLAHLNILDQLFILYKVWDFYVEICYDPLIKKVFAVRPFDTHQGLIPYFDIN